MSFVRLDIPGVESPRYFLGSPIILSDLPRGTAGLLLTGNGPAPPSYQAFTLAQFPTAAAGGLLMANGPGVASSYLASGGAGTLLTGNGVGAAPSWQAFALANFPLGTAGFALIGNGASASSYQGFLQAGTGAVTRTWNAKASDIFSVKDFGATGNGSTDDTSAINAAISAITAASGGTLFFPPGTYKVSAALPVGSSGVKILGSGRNNTFINTTSSTLDVFQFNGTTFDSSIESLTIGSTATTPTAGAGVASSNGVGDIRVRDVRVQNTWNGITCQNASITGVVQLSHVDVSTVFNDGILVIGCSQFFADNVTTFQNAGRRGNVGVHIQDAGAFYLSQVTTGGNNVGIQIDPPTGKTVQDGFIVNCELDSHGSNGLLIDTSGGGKAFDIVIANTRAGFSGGFGFGFNGANTSNISMSNCTAVKNTAEGIKVTNLSDSIIRGCQILGNAATGGSNNGIDLVAGTGITIMENRIGPYPGAVNNQPYGVQVEATFSGFAVIAHNDLRGNLTGGVNNLSTSTGVFSHSNIIASPVSLGHSQGSGGTVTQATSKSTGVTLNKSSGQITMNNAALAAGAGVLFNLTSSFFNPATDVVFAHHATGGSAASYRVDVFASSVANTVGILVTNTTGGSLSEAIVINFVIIKGSAT